MPSERQAGERVGQALAIARQMLESAALSLGQLPATANGDRWVAALGAILAGLEQLGTADVEDRAFLERLAAAAADTEQLCAELVARPDEELVGHVARRLEAVARQLAQCRSDCIDLLVSRQAVRAPSDSRDRAATPLEHFRASIGTACLQGLRRRPIALRIESAAGRAAESANDGTDDDDEPASGAAASAAVETTGSPPQAGGADSAVDPAERRHFEWFARDCLSDLAALGNLRVPLDEMVWTVPESFEERLLANLDALLALGLPYRLADDGRFDLFDCVQRYAADTPAPDLGRQFARVLALCSVTGEDAVRAALLALRQAAPSTYPGFRDALSLAPHPAIGPLLTRMLVAGGESRWLVTALEVLRFRREASFASLLPLTAHPDPAVIAAAARGLGYVADAAPAIELLSRLARDEEDDLVVAEAATSLLLHGSLEGLELARARLLDAAALSDRARAAFLRVVALAGDVTDRPLLAGAIEPTARDATLVGWSGHSALVPWLIGVLADANVQAARSRPSVHSLERAASRALERLTGAALHDEPLDCVAYDFANEPALSADAWRGYWDEHARDFDEGLKVRAGQPYSPRATLAELAGTTPTHLRVDGALELGLLHGRTRFEPADWIARQRVVLRGLEPLVGSEPVYAPGRWPAQVLAERARAGRRGPRPEPAAPLGPGGRV